MSKSNSEFAQSIVDSTQQNIDIITVTTDLAATFRK